MASLRCDAAQMSRTTYVHDPDSPTGEMIDKRLVQQRRVQTHHVINDAMDAIVHPVNGKRYDSKSKFRAVTRMHGLTEAGNEQVKFDRPRETGLSVGQELARAWDQLSSR